jgi:prolyl oligopeptidase
MPQRFLPRARRRSVLPILALALTATALCSCASPEKGGADLDLPETRTVPVRETLHGVEVADPYRWLEDEDAAEVGAWIEAQNGIARPWLERLPARAAYIERLEKLWTYERSGLPIRRGDRWFWTHDDGRSEQPRLMVGPRPYENGRVLLDPNLFSEDGTKALSGWQPSPDGQRLAYAVSDGGSDWRVWQVIEVDGGRVLTDALRFVKFSGVSFTRDGKHLYYSRYPVGPDGEGDDDRQVIVMRHEVGTAQARDVEVFRVRDHERRNPYATVTEDGRYLVLTERDGWLANGVKVLDLARGETTPRPLFDRWDALYEFLGNRGSLFYFRTNHEAPRWRIVAVDLDQPPGAPLREIVPQGPHAMEEASLVNDQIISVLLVDAASRVEVHDRLGGRLRTLDLPGLGSASGFTGRAEDTESWFSLSTYTRPARVMRLDLATGKVETVKEPGISFDSEPYETTRVFVTGKDGTKVPLFLVHKKDARPDNGPHPTILYGYGGFNISLTPGFRLDRAAWIERGGVWAVACLRGGGEYGKAWHRAGTKTAKQNVFDDFMACAEHLSAEGWTSPRHLGIHGGSNGGLLVGACLVQRPELFGAAVPAVGVLDMLRYHLQSANARQWSSDYGLAENEEEFHALYRYSPYHNARPAAYPPTLVTTAKGDDRVAPWHSYKFAAALQAAQRGPDPVLLRTETRAGHGAGKPRWMRIEEIADRLAFFEACLRP